MATIVAGQTGALVEHNYLQIYIVLWKPTYPQSFMLIYGFLFELWVLNLYRALYISFSHLIGFCFDERSAALLSRRMRHSHRTTPL